MSFMSEPMDSGWEDSENCKRCKGVYLLSSEGYCSKLCELGDLTGRLSELRKQTAEVEELFAPASVITTKTNTTKGRGRKKDDKR